MDDEKTEAVRENKLWKWIKRIFKSLYILILTVLLAAGLYFQAPWKVVTLVIVFLLASTILPKVYRKWFWLTVTAVAVCLAVWVFMPEDNEGWEPYTLDKEFAKMEAARSVPDEDNAAVLYKRLLDEYERLKHMPPSEPPEDANDTKCGYSGLYPDFWNDELDAVAMDTYWSSREYPELAEWIKSREFIINTLMQASELDECRFGLSINYNKLEFKETGIKDCAKLLLFAANNDIADGRLEVAIQKYLAALKAADHLFQQPPLIDQLVAMSIEALTYKQLQKLAIKRLLNNQHLDQIEAGLKLIRHDPKNDWSRTLDYEKLLGKNSILSMSYEVNSEGKARLTRSHWQCLKQMGTDMPEPGFWQKNLARVGMLPMYFFWPSDPEKISDAFDVEYERFYGIPDKKGVGAAENEEIFLCPYEINYRYFTKKLMYILCPAYNKVYQLRMKVVSEQRASRIIVSLARYKNNNGDWPESLDEVTADGAEEIFTDAMNGGSFVYKKTEDAFKLYSKGLNGIDEEGEGGFKAKDNDPDDILYWPQKSE